MNLSGIVHADLSTVGEWIADGWRWWLSELSGMAPHFARRGGRSATYFTPPEGDDPAWRRHDPRGIHVLPPLVGAKTSGILALPPESVLIRTVDLPALADADLRRLIALDIDRLTPFAAGAVWTDVETGRRDALGRIEVTLGVIARTTATEVLAAAAHVGIVPTRLALRHENGLRFDFLRAIRGRRGLTVRARWWIAVTLLFAINLSALVARDIASVDRLRAAVEAEAPAARTTTMLRSRVMREQARRVRLVRLRAHYDPLPLIARITRALPPGAWVMRMVWNGHSVRLIGYQAQGIDVLAGLRRVPGLARVRTSSSDIAPEAGQARPFDVTADVIASGGR